MKKIGLTGIIGSGKTTAAKYFNELGVPIFIADESAKKLMNNDSDLKQKIIDLLGRSSYKNGVLNKKFILNKIFTNKKLLDSINKIVHPKVQNNFDNWSLNQNSPYVIYEAALIFENGSESFFDKIICIKTPLDLIHKRISKRVDYSENTVNKILSNQISQEIKCSKSDFCIENISLKILSNEINKIHKKLLQMTSC